LKEKKGEIFGLSFKDFYGIKENGEYQFQIAGMAV